MTNITNLFNNVPLREAQTDSSSGGFVIDPEVQRSIYLLENYRASRKLWETKAKKWDDFRRGYQLTKEEIASMKKRRQPPIILNVIEPAVEQAKAMLTTNKPRFSTTGREDSDTRTGKIFSDMLSYVWEISDGNMKLKQTIDEYYVRGLGVLMAYVDPFANHNKGEVFIDSVDSFDVFVDPNSKDPYGRDASNIIIAKVMTEEQIEISYPQYISKLKNGQTFRSDFHPISQGYDSEGLHQTVNDYVHIKYEVIDRYTKIKDYNFRVIGNGEEHILTEEQFKNFIQQPAVAVIKQGEDPQFITDDDMVKEYFQVIQNYGLETHLEMDSQTNAPVMAAGATSPTMIPGSTTTMRIIRKGDLIENGVYKSEQILETKIKRVLSIGQILCFSGIIDIPEYPIVLVPNHHDRTPYPDSDVKMVEDLQAQINRIESLIVIHATNSTNTKIFYPRGAVDKKDIAARWGNSGTEFFEYNAEIGKPEQFYPPPLPNELYKNKADKIAEIERVLGIYALQQGDANVAPDTYKGTIAIDEYGLRRIKSKIDDIEGAMNALARVVIKLMQQVYTEEKVIRLLQPNNAPKELSINTPIYDDFGNVVGKFNDITTGEYDVIVVSGSMLPANRWAQFEYYMTMYERGLIDQVEVLKKSELVDVEGVLNRHSQLVQMQQTIQQLQQQIKQLSGDLQTAQRESLHDKKRVEVEKFKTELHKYSESARQAVQLHNQLSKNQFDLFSDRLDMENKLAKEKFANRYKPQMQNAQQGEQI